MQLYCTARFFPRYENFLTIFLQPSNGARLSRPFKKFIDFAMRYLYNVLNRIKLHGCRTAALKGNIGENPRQPPLLCQVFIKISPQRFYRYLFGAFPQRLTRRSAATTSFGVAEIRPKIYTLKFAVSTFL